MPFLFAACWRLGAAIFNNQTSMKKELTRPSYTSPTVEVLTVRVERGFAGSVFGSNSGQNDGTDGINTRDDLNYDNDLFS